MPPHPFRNRVNKCRGLWTEGSGAARCEMVYWSGEYWASAATRLRSRKRKNAEVPVLAPRARIRPSCHPRVDHEGAHWEPFTVSRLVSPGDLRIASFLVGRATAARRQVSL